LSRILLNIAITHLLSRKKQTLVAAAGVMFGITSFITLVSFMTGLNEMLDGLILNSAPHVHIYNEIKPSKEQPLEYNQQEDYEEIAVYSVKPKRTQTGIHNAIPLIRQLSRDTELKGVAPMVSAQVFYLDGTIEMNGLVKGIDVDKHSELFSFDDYVIKGNSTDLKYHDNGIVLGSGIADKMSLKIGHSLQVSSPHGGTHSLKVVGLYQSGIADVDNMQSYVSVATAQKILGQNKTFITDILIKMKDLDLAESKTAEIIKKYKVHAMDFRTANSQIDTGTSIRNMITYAVSITLLIVAGFGIYNILNMLIYEKMNDIAILKAVGFSGKDVMKIFISQALIIGITGGVTGLLAGFGLAKWIDQLPFDTQALPTIKTFPVAHDIKYYIIGLVFALISTFLAGFLPARRAQKIDPVEIIRGQ
jgi:lipoprotein-releasing system permease protein